jgi:hypothetical protein
VGLKTSEIGPGWFSYAISATLRNLFTNRNEGFELTGFKNLSENSKAFGAKPTKNLVSP